MSAERERHTLSLGYAFDRLADDERKLVLDLGPASSANIAFFAERSSRLYIADFHRSLTDAGASARASITAFEDACIELLPYDPDVRFDLVLCWDLLNYLEADEIEVLTRHLSQFFHSATVLLAMISMRPQIAAKPARITILDVETLDFDADVQSRRPGPLYKERDLLRAMPGFQVRKCFLSKRGVQEYVFLYDPASASAGPDERFPTHGRSF